MKTRVYTHKNMPEDLGPNDYALPMKAGKNNGTLTIRIPQDLKEQAEEAGLNLSELCRQAIASALKQIRGKK